jgi:tripartite-type tricarboxylate transporter receptor subunit TctC
MEMFRTGRGTAWAALMAVLLFIGGCDLAPAYPSRPLTLIVPWGAGGGTDAIARMIAPLMAQDLGQPVNVVNLTGGSGVVGHQAIADAAPDGYTIGMLTTEVAMMHHRGLTTLTGASFTPLGLLDFDAAAIQVRADSPYQNLGDLLKAIRARPGTLTASGTAQGGIWNVALYGLLDRQRIEPGAVVWVPSNSSQAGLQNLVSGMVDIVATSHAESRMLIDEGKVRSLAVLADGPSSLYPDVPTARQAVGTDWTLGGWRGVAAPKGLPPAVEDRLTAAVKAAYDNPAFHTFMTTRGFGMRWAGPDEFAALMATSDEQMGRMMTAVGLAR